MKGLRARDALKEIGIYKAPANIQIYLYVDVPISHRIARQNSSPSRDSVVSYNSRRMYTFLYPSIHISIAKINYDILQCKDRNEKRSIIPDRTDQFVFRMCSHNIRIDGRIITCEIVISCSVNSTNRK